MSKIESVKQIDTDEPSKSIRGNAVLANIKDYLSEKDSKALSRQKSDKSRSGNVKKMTSITLDSSDRRLIKDSDGTHVEAVGGRIITTLKKQP